MNNLSKLKIIGFLWGVSFFMPIISLYFLNSGVSLQAIVVSQTLYSIFSFIGEIPTGILADKLGQKIAIVLGYIIEGLGISVMFFLPNTLGLYLAYSAIGIAESFLSGSQEAFIYESFKQENSSGSYQKYYSSFLSIQLASLAVTTFITGIAINYFGKSIYPLLILLTASAFLLAAILAWTLQPIRETIKQNVQESTITIIRKSYILIKSHKTIFSLLLITILTISGEYFLYGVYQPYFQQAHVAPLYLGLVLSLGAALNYLLLKYSYLLERYFPFENIILILNIPLALGYILMTIFINPIFLVLSFVSMKGLFNIQAPIVSDYINEYTESNIRATVLSGISLGKAFFSIIIRLVLAIIIGVWGLKMSFLLQGFYLLIGAFVSYWLLVKCGCTYKIHKSSK